MRLIKSPFWHHFSPPLLACPFGHGLVCATRASLLALKTGVKIIDFLGHSSFATASNLIPFSPIFQPKIILVFKFLCYAEKARYINDSIFSRSFQSGSSKGISRICNEPTGCWPTSMWSQYPSPSIDTKY
jgi:hypothetical protein